MLSSFTRVQWETSQPLVWKQPILVSISAQAWTTAVSSPRSHLPFSSSTASPQVASDINSSTRPQVHHHFAAIQPLKKWQAWLSLMVFPLSELSARAISRWAVVLPHVQWCSLCCCILNHKLCHLAQQCKQKWSCFRVSSMMCIHFSFFLNSSHTLCCCCMWKKVLYWFCMSPQTKTTLWGDTKRCMNSVSRQWWVCKVTTDTKQHGTSMGVKDVCTTKLCMKQT